MVNYCQIHYDIRRITSIKYKLLFTDFYIIYSLKSSHLSVQSKGQKKPQLEIHELEAPSRGKIEKKELLQKLNYDSVTRRA